MDELYLLVRLVSGKGEVGGRWDDKGAYVVFRRNYDASLTVQFLEQSCMCMLLMQRILLRNVGIFFAGVTFVWLGH